MSREIFLYTLPTTFTLTLPMGVLVGILVGLSRLAADSEVTAIRASGMGVGMFVRAIAIFAIGAWMLGMVNNIYVAPKSAIALNHLQDKLKSSQASFEIQPHVFYEEFKNIVLYVQDAIPVQRPVAVAGHLPGRRQRPVVSEGHAGQARRPVERLARQVALASGGRHPAGERTQGQRPVLHHDV